MNNLKFFYNGIKVNEKLIPCYYSLGGFKYDNTSISIYAKSILSKLPNIGSSKVQNDSEMQSDYFESDRIILKQNNPYYQEALKAFIKSEEKALARYTKKNDKILSSGIESSTTKYIRSEIEGFNFRINFATLLLKNCK